MIQIIATTDGKFIGTVLNKEEPIIFDGVDFTPDIVIELDAVTYRFFNSNYSFDAQEI
jgi:hypothetical protein